MKIGTEEESGFFLPARAGRVAAKGALRNKPVYPAVAVHSSVSFRLSTPPR